MPAEAYADLLWALCPLPQPESELAPITQQENPVLAGVPLRELIERTIAEHGLHVELRLAPLPSRVASRIKTELIEELRQALICAAATGERALVIAGESNNRVCLVVLRGNTKIASAAWPLRNKRVWRTKVGSSSSVRPWQFH